MMVFIRFNSLEQKRKAEPQQHSSNNWFTLMFLKKKMYLTF